MQPDTQDVREAARIFDQMVRAEFSPSVYD